MRVKKIQLTHDKGIVCLLLNIFLVAKIGLS